MKISQKRQQQISLKTQKKYIERYWQKKGDPTDDIDRLYGSRKEGGRGLTGREDGIDLSMQGLEDNIRKSKERLITAANSSIGNISTNRKTIKTRKEKWEEKQLHGYFKQKLVILHTRKHGHSNEREI